MLPQQPPQDVSLLTDGTLSQQRRIALQQQPMPEQPLMAETPMLSDEWTEEPFVEVDPDAKQETTFDLGSHLHGLWTQAEADKLDIEGRLL